MNMLDFKVEESEFSVSFKIPRISKVRMETHANLLTKGFERGGKDP